MGHDLEVCNSFTYLGVVFTTRLSTTKHIEYVLSKCNAKIGFLFSRFPLKEMPLNVVLDLFRVYIFPIVSYALPIWLPALSGTSTKSLNSMFSKYLKRYLGLPYTANNAIVHFLTGTEPLCTSLNNKALKAAFKINYPVELEGFLPQVYKFIFHTLLTIKKLITPFQKSLRTSGFLHLYLIHCLSVLNRGELYYIASWI